MRADFWCFVHGCGFCSVAAYQVGWHERCGVGVVMVLGVGDRLFEV